MKSNFKLLFVFFLFIIFIFLNNINLKSESNLDLVQKCKSPTKEEANLCWIKSVQQIFAQNGAKGVEKSLEFLETLYNSGSDISDEDCHAISHEIGKKAYYFFKEKQNFNATRGISYCGYGFFHAFISSLTKEGKDLSAVKEFCNKVDKELSAKIPPIRGNCYHGIGHGLVEDPPDSLLWGDAKAIVRRSFFECSKISKNQKNIEDCFDGSFNALALFMSHKNYGLSFNTDNVFEFCETLPLPKPISIICYHQMANQLSTVLPIYDINSQMKFLLDLEDKELAYTTIRAVSRHVITRSKEGVEFLIQDCRNLPDRFRLGCLNGLARGFAYTKGTIVLPDKAISFCKSFHLTEEERDNCYKYVLNLIKINIPANKVFKLCPSIDKKYQNLCKDKNYKYVVNL